MTVQSSAKREKIRDSLLRAAAVAASPVRLSVYIKIIGFGLQFWGCCVRLGTNVYVGAWTTINDCVIGKRTLIGSHTGIVSGDHQHGGAETLKENKPEIPMPIPEKLTTIGNNVWTSNGAAVFFRCWRQHHYRSRFCGY